MSSWTLVLCPLLLVARAAGVPQRDQPGRPVLAKAGADSVDEDGRNVGWIIKQAEARGFVNAAPFMDSALGDGVSQDSSGVDGSSFFVESSQDGQADGLEPFSPTPEQADTVQGELLNIWHSQQTDDSSSGIVLENPWDQAHDTDVELAKVSSIEASSVQQAPEKQVQEFNKGGRVIDPPAPTPLQITECNRSEYCVFSYECQDPGILTKKQCVTGESILGVCCPLPLEPIPADVVSSPSIDGLEDTSFLEPAVSDDEEYNNLCATEDVCVDPLYCDADGFISDTPVSTLNTIYLIVAVKCQTTEGGRGMCCRRQPPTLEPVQISCDPSEQRCVPEADCNEEEYIEQDTAFPGPTIEEQLEYCVMRGGRGKGVCCRRPPRIGTEIYCNLNEECVLSQYCGADGFVTAESLGGFQDENVIQLGPYGTFCKTSAGQQGRCCRVPDPSWPQGVPLPRCGHKYEIALPDQGTRHIRESAFGEIPWQASIFEKGSDVFVCGGTIISHRHILTSDHCIEKYSQRDLHVRVGEYIINSDIEPLVPQDIEVISIRTHPRRGALFNDIAVVYLAKDIQFDAHVQPICLPERGQNFTGRCLVSGWGKDAFFGNYVEALRKLEVPMVEHEECQRSLRSSHVGDFLRLEKSMICAGGEKGADACRGDAGGPLACPSADGTMVLAGIAAWSVGCGQVGVPSVYTSVGSTLSFTQHYVFGTHMHPNFVQP